MKITIETIKEEKERWDGKLYEHEQNIIVFTYSKEEIKTFTTFLEINKEYKEISNKRNKFIQNNKNLIPYESVDVMSYGAGDKLLESVNKVLEEAEMDEYYEEYKFIAKDEEGNKLKDISAYLELLQSYSSERWQHSYC